MISKARTLLTSDVKSLAKGMLHAHDSYAFRIRDEKAREFLFGNQPRWLGTLLTLRPDVAFFLMSFLGFVLILLAWLSGVLIVPTTYGEVGFLANVNWSIMFTLVGPYIFSIVAGLNRRCPRVIESLTDSDVALITVDTTRTSQPYYDRMIEENKGLGKARLWGSLFWAVVMFLVVSWWMLADFAHATPNQNPMKYIFDGQWATAWRIPLQFLPHGQHATMLGNAAFDLAAFLMEIFYFFLGLFWLQSFWRFLRSLSTLLVNPDQPYKLNLWINDRENRLGLGSLGSLFTRFLQVVVIFLFYGAATSFLLTAWAGRKMAGEYMQQILSQKEAAIHFLQSLAVTKGLADLFGDAANFSSGLLLLKLVVILPIFVVIYVPLIVLRRYLEEQLDKQRLENLKAYHESVKDDPSKTDEPIDKSWDKLNSAEVWPCGNAVAIRYFTYMTLLLIAIFVPPIGILLMLGIVIGIAIRKVVPMLPFVKA